MLCAIQAFNNQDDLDKLFSALQDILAITNMIEL